MNIMLLSVIFLKSGYKYPLDDFLSIQLRRAGLNVVYVLSIMA